MTPTKREAALLDFMKAYLVENGYTPSYDECKEALGLLSKSGVHRMVKGLEQKGFIKSSPHRSRSIEICGFEPPSSFAVNIVNSQSLTLELATGWIDDLFALGDNLMPLDRQAWRSTCRQAMRSRLKGHLGAGSDTITIPEGFYNA